MGTTTRASRFSENGASHVNALSSWVSHCDCRICLRGCRVNLKAVPTELLKMGSDRNSVSGGIPSWTWTGSCYTNKYGFPDDVPDSFNSTPHPRLRRSGEPVNQYKKLLCERVRIPGRCSRSPPSASSENRILLSLASACSLAPFIFPSWAVFLTRTS